VEVRHISRKKRKKREEHAERSYPSPRLKPGEGRRKEHQRGEEKNHILLRFGCVGSDKVTGVGKGIAGGRKEQE